MDLKKLVGSLLAKDPAAGAAAGDPQIQLEERLVHARRTMAARLTGKAGEVPMLGEILSDMGSVEKRHLDAALDRQKSAVSRYFSLEKQVEDTIWDLIGSVTGTLDLEQVLTLTMENAAKVTGAKASTLFLRDPASGELVFSVPTGPAAHQLKDVRLPHGQGIAGWVAVHRKALIVPDVQADSRFYAAIDQTTGFVTRSVLAVPLIHGEELLGVLETINKQDNESFSEEDALLLTVFADQAATALVNAKVHAGLKAQLEEIEHSRDRLVEDEKYRALKTMSDGLSHDFKNLLNAVIGFSELLALDIADPELRSDVDQIASAGRRALERVHSQIVAFQNCPRFNAAKLSNMVSQRSQSRVLLKNNIASEVERFQNDPADLSLKLITRRMALSTQPLPLGSSSFL